MTRSAFCLAILSSTLLAATLAGAAIRYAPYHGPPASAQAAATQAEQRYFERLFSEQGIDPGSDKAQIIRKWVTKIRHDPTIAAGMPGGDGVNRIFLDADARQTFMANGVAHLEPADRLDYVKLLAKFLDELVPVNCFGLVDMGAVMNRITLREMSDADADRYFGLLYKILLSNRREPIAAPTLQQFAEAQRQFAHALLAQLGTDEANIERFKTYADDPSVATPADTCWATRVTLHAMIAMPDPSRDVMLLRTVIHNGPDGDAPAKADPTPASSQPAHAPGP
jgi:hypothetical protein